MAEPTIFTRIINGEIPCHKIYEDELVYAFLDINPVSRGHALVIPRQEVDHLDDLDEETYTHLMSVVRKLSRHFKQVLKPQRIGLLVLGEEVPHAHVHIIPLFSLTEIRLNRAGSVPPSTEELATIAESLRL